MVYATIEEGIEAQAKLLAKYQRMGLKTIPQIGARYSPPGAANDPNQTNASWPANVARNYKRLQDAAALPQPAPVPPGGPAGSSLKHMIKGMSMKQRMEGSGGTNVASLAPNITINATSAQPEAIAQRVRSAMRDSTAEFLAAAKRARSHENRLGYV